MAYKETNRHLFLTVVEAGKSKIEVSADSVPGESYFSGLQMDAFLEILTWLREVALMSLLLPIRALIPSRRLYLHELI